MDQTSIYIDMNPKTTITFRGERDVDVGQGCRVEVDGKTSPMASIPTNNYVG
ncbi:hypothetical protein F442_12502 [Phytophthora nicotianae P10297]|uniref:Uncharacterized protein n=2 Tax=Phytophthora nicotianae TaxID=4792 RepID=W2Z1K3_PHYNI|nr:hypothetical protein F444_12688 [Phytophthora nicotianae P1976]ETP40109.1 hypothetical protein F442_12502 [Phytophthora nicotianae P10297]